MIKNRREKLLNKFWNIFRLQKEWHVNKKIQKELNETMTNNLSEVIDGTNDTSLFIGTLIQESDAG